MLFNKATRKVRIAPSRTFLHAPVVTERSVFVGSEDGEILRLRWPLLETAWRVPAEGFFADSAFDDIVLLKSLDTLQYRGLHGDGGIAWTLELREGSTPWVRWGDKLFCNNPGVFVADARTGEVIEHYDVAGRPIRAGGLIAPGLYVYSTEEAPDLLRIYDLSAGRLVWERNLRAEVRAAYGITDPHVGVLAGSTRSDVLVAKSEKHFFGLSRQDGHLLWRRALWVEGVRFAFEGGRIYAWAAQEDDPRGDRLVCLDEATGEAIYDRRMSSFGGEVAAAYSPTKPSISSGRIAFGTRAGLLAIFRLSDGELAWSHNYKTQLYDAVLDGNRLVVTAADGNLLVFEGKAANA